MHSLSFSLSSTHSGCLVCSAHSPGFHGCIWLVCLILVHRSLQSHTLNINTYAYAHLHILHTLPLDFRLVESEAVHQSRLEIQAKRETDLCVSRPSERQIVCSFTSKAHSCEGGVERSMCTCWQIRKAAKNKPSTAKSLHYLTAAGTNTCIFVLFLVQQERKQDERRMKVEQRLRKCHRNQPFLFSSNTYNMLQEGKCGCLWAAGMRLLHTFKSTFALQM